MGISDSAPAASLYSQEQWKRLAPTLNSVSAGPGDASAVLAGARPDRGDHGRSELIRISQWRSPADAVERIHHALTRKNAAEWILKGDIKTCFDKNSHSWRLGHIPMDKSILKKWLKAGFIDRQTLLTTDEGVPQGGIASPALTNMTLDGLERTLLRKFPTNRWRDRQRVNLVRFADDILVTGRSQDQLEQEVKPVIEKFLAERGLELSSEKTRTIHVSKGFDFLGQHIRRYGNGKVLTKPAKQSISSLLDQIRS